MWTGNSVVGLKKKKNAAMLYWWEEVSRPIYQHVCPVSYKCLNLSYLFLLLFCVMTISPFILCDMLLPSGFRGSFKGVGHIV